MGVYYRQPPPLPPVSSLPFPGNLVRQCSDCNLRRGCTAPVPGNGPVPAYVMLVGQNPGCLPAGELVSTPDGVRDISKIRVGDTVLDGLGSAQRVVRVFSGESDQLVTLKARKLVRVALTANHPVLAISPRLCYDQHTRKYCFPCSRGDCSYKYYASYQERWVPAGRLCVGDHVVVPAFKATRLDNTASSRCAGIVRIPFPQRELFRKTKFKNTVSEHWSARKGFRLGRGLAYVLGWYMAEGSASVRGGTVQFSLGNGDGQSQHILEEQCRMAFGVGGSWRIRLSQSTRDYMMHSRPLAAWFIDLFGVGSHHKHVPSYIFHSDVRIIRSFIIGWYRGDGRHKRSGKNDGIVTASKEAAYGLRDLLLRIGTVPTLHEECWKGYAGRPSVGSCGYVVEFPSSLVWDRDTTAVPFRGKRLLCVDSVKHLDKHCTVYNIETEDNQYLVPFVVHNSQEDAWGKPFVGQAGRQLDTLLFQAGVPRDTAFITNLVRCLTPNNSEPKPVSVKSCAKWLDLELGIVDPRIIVAMGKPAISRFLGADVGTVEHLHGKPVAVPINGVVRIVLPCYHPAAAIHNTSLLRQLQDDFQVLRGLVQGRDIADYIVADEYPDPVYRVADTDHKLKQMLDEVRSIGECAVDTETVTRNTELWSVQVSSVPGTAWFVPMKPGYRGRIDLTEWQSHIIVHHYLNDIRWANIPEQNFSDTMVKAYLCVARDTPILKADLTWYPADAVRVGDVVVGFDDSYQGKSGNKPRSTLGFSRRHLRKSIVEQVSTHLAACFDVALSDGRRVVCTEDHKWLVGRLGCKRLEWLTTGFIRKRMGIVCKKGPHGGEYAQYRIRSLVPSTWGTDSSYDAGWLSGIIDGEGCLSAQVSNGAQLTIAQKLGTVLCKADALLRERGYRITTSLYKDAKKDVNDVYTISVSGMAQVMRLLGQVHPLRMNRSFWVGKAFPNHGEDATIVSITPVGEQDVVSITTSTGTYIANGLASHNCGLPQGLKELASRLCGIKMITYSEMVRPGQRKLSTQYLTEAATRDWPDPPDIEEVKWDNKAGKIITRVKHPKHILSKVRRALADSVDNLDVDLYKRWHDIPEEERSAVEKKLGRMPESSLADIKFEDAVDYSCRDAMATLRVSHKIDKIVTDLGLDFVLHMDTAILPMVDEMMHTGWAVNIDHFKALSVEYRDRMATKAEELAGIVGHSFNPNSSNQVAKVVYGEMGFKPTAFTPTKEISTDDQELKKIKHPVTKGIIEYRRLSKMKGTYTDSLVELALPDSATSTTRIHTTLKTTRVETGRLSSADPNLQNIPVRSKEGKKIRLGFIASLGMLLGEGDYAQIEMVTLAHLSRCKRLIELFLRGGDPHTEMAATIFGVSLEEAKQDKYRYPVKRLNFGIAYLIGALGLSNQILEYIADLKMEGEPVEIEPWDELTCNKFIAEWYKLNPEVKDFQLEMAAQARRMGYVSDLFGRIRYVPEVHSPTRSVSEAGLRQAANMPVTATAQGIIKIAMGELWRELPKTGWKDKVRWVMQIHDSLVVEMTDDEDVWKPYLSWMGKVMCGGVKLLVPVKVDFKTGRSWGEMEKVKL